MVKLRHHWLQPRQEGWLLWSPSPADILTACTCWSSCSTSTSGRSSLTLSAPSSSTSSSCCTGSTTLGSACVCSRRWQNSSSHSSSHCRMETLPPSDVETNVLNLIVLVNTFSWGLLFWLLDMMKNFPKTCDGQTCAGSYSKMCKPTVVSVCGDNDGKLEQIFSVTHAWGWGVCLLQNIPIGPTHE